MSPGLVPPGAALRIIGDVHGDARAFAHAVATERFVIQLGDLVDYGPDSATVLTTMFALIDAGRGLFLLGNHDFKLAQVLLGRSVATAPALLATLAALPAAMVPRTLDEIAAAPAWLQLGSRLFVHAGFHSAMLEGPPPRPNPVAAGRIDGVLARALYGEPTGRIQADGFPERSLRWVDRIPEGITVYCGHDQRSRDGRPYVRQGRGGGSAVFLDTGAGKGGHLSWIDLAPEG